MAGLKTDELILAALEEGAAEQGLDIVSVEVTSPSTHPTLRVRVDVLEGGPIDIDRVTACTPWVSDAVEALDPFPGAYELEVSSPGIDRPLRRPRDFAAFVGSDAEVTLREPVEGRKAWSGKIVSADEGTFVLLADGAEVTFSFDNLKQAKLKPDFEQILAAAKKAEKAEKEARKAEKKARRASGAQASGAEVDSCAADDAEDPDDFGGVDGEVSEDE